MLEMIAPRTIIAKGPNDKAPFGPNGSHSSSKPPSAADACGCHVERANGATNMIGQRNFHRGSERLSIPRNSPAQHCEDMSANSRRAKSMFSAARRLWKWAWTSGASKLYSIQMLHLRSQTISTCGSSGATTSADRGGPNALQRSSSRSDGHRQPIGLS